MSDEETQPEESEVIDKAEAKDKAKRTIFIGNVNAKVKRASVKKLFKPYGTIEAVYKRSLLQKNEKLQKKMLGTDEKLKLTNGDAHFYVRFTEEEAANKATELNGTVFEKRYMRVTLSSERTQDPKRSVFVGNIPFTVSSTEQKLMEFFIRHAPGAEVQSVHIVHDKSTGANLGYGFVNLKQRSGVPAALKLDGERFKGRPLRVTKMATKKNQRPVSDRQSKKQKVKATRKRTAAHDMGQKLTNYTITKKTAALQNQQLSKKVRKSIKSRQSKRSKGLL